MLFKKHQNLPTWPFVLALIAATTVLIVFAYAVSYNNNTQRSFGDVATSAPNSDAYKNEMLQKLHMIVNAAQAYSDGDNTQLVSTLTAARADILAERVPTQFKSTHLFVVISLDNALLALKQHEKVRFDGVIRDIAGVIDAWNAGIGVQGSNT